LPQLLQTSQLPLPSLWAAALAAAGL